MPMTADMSKPSKPKHLVDQLRGALPCLSVIYVQDGRHRLLVASGFVLQADGGLFWVTAGHVINLIRGYHKAGTLRQIRWQDGGPASIPATFDSIDQFAMDVEGVDLAIVELHPNVAANLKQGPRFHPFAIEDCIDHSALTELFKSDPNRRSEAWVLGYPQEWAKYTETIVSKDLIRFDIVIRSVQVPVIGPAQREELESRGILTPDSFWSFNCVYATIAELDHPDAEPLSGIEGVSGGPVVVVVDGRVLIAGIQTAWIPRAHVIRYVPMDHPKEILTRYFEWRKKRTLGGDQ